MRKGLTVLVCSVLILTSAGCINDMNEIEMEFSRAVLRLVEDGGEFTVEAESSVVDVSASNGEPLRWSDFFFRVSDFNGQEVVPEVEIEGPEAVDLPGFHMILYENASGKDRIDEGDRLVMVGMDESFRGHQFDLRTEESWTLPPMANIHLSVEAFDFDIYKIEPHTWGTIAFLNITLRIERNYLGPEGPRWDRTTLELEDENESNVQTLSLEPYDAGTEERLQVRYLDQDPGGMSMERGDTILLTRVPMLYLNGFVNLYHPGIGGLTGRRIPWDPFYEDGFGD